MPEKCLKSGIWACALLVFLFFNGCYGAIHVKDEKPAEAGTLDRASVERGQRVYEENCQSCHGEKGRGDGPRKNQFEPPPPDLRKPGLHVTTTGLESIVDFPYYSSQAMRRRIRHGTEDMPGFKNSFSDQEIKDIINFIRFLTMNGRQTTADAP